MTIDSTAVTDFVHCARCIFELHTMKLFTAAEMAFKGHSRSTAMSSFVRSPRPSIRNQKSRLRLFSDKIAEMTLKMDQGHQQWQNSIGHISLSVSGL